MATKTKKLSIKNIFNKMTAQRKAIRGKIAVKKKNSSSIKKAYSSASAAKVAKIKKAQSMVGGKGTYKPTSSSYSAAAGKYAKSAAKFAKNKAKYLSQGEDTTQAERYEMIKKRKALGPHD